MVPLFFVNLYMMDLDLKEDFDLINTKTVREQIKTPIKYTCKVCNKKVFQKGFFKKLFNFVCPVCKRRKTNIEKYGTVAIGSINAKKTFLEKYGVENPSQLKSVVEKRKKTSLEKYGVDNPAKAKHIKDKIKQTNLEKYGCTCSLHNEKIAEKVKQTNLEKYGVECYLSCEEKKEKSKETCLKKYGVDHPMKTEKIKQRCVSSIRKGQLENRRLYCENLIKSKNFLYKEIKPLLYEITCKCGNTFLWTRYSYVNKKYFSTVLYCEKCYKKPVSKYEDKLAEILTDFDIIRNDRQIIKPKELDIYIPNWNIAIEFDGDYWHNNSTKTLEKFYLCEKLGIRLINIFEHEWNETKIKSFLYSILDKNKSIYAKNCIVKEIDNNLYKQFCNENHLQNYEKASIKFGLFYDEELVQLMSFSKPRFSTKYQYEIIRECSKCCYNIIDGKQLLFESFIKQYKPSSIIIYCDKRYFTGKDYLKLNFRLNHQIKPSYFYIKDMVITKFDVHKLNFTEEDLFNSGYMKLYDFGQNVYIWRK